MALVIEDGTGVVGANVWEDVADSKTALDELGLTAFGLLSPSVAQATAIQAVQLTAVILEAWIDGERLVSDQGLPFPRVQFTDARGDHPAGVPDYIKWASRYFMHDAARGIPLHPGDESAGILSDRVGPITVAYQWGSARGVETRHFWAWHHLTRAFDPNRRR